MKRVHIIMFSVELTGLRNIVSLLSYVRMFTVLGQRNFIICLAVSDLLLYPIQITVIYICVCKLFM